jgi:hypothetical protein
MVQAAGIAGAPDGVRVGWYNSDKDIIAGHEHVGLLDRNVAIGAHRAANVD